MSSVATATPPVFESIETSVDSASAAVVAWIDSVFTEARVDGDAALRRELANRFASLVTLGPLSIYALDHGAKAFCRWLVEEDQDHALDRLDAAMQAVAEQSAAAGGGEVDGHLVALAELVVGALAVQRPHWVAGVAADHGR